MANVSDKSLQKEVKDFLPDGGEYVPLEKILEQPVLRDEKFRTTQLLTALVAKKVLEVEYPDEGAPSGRFRRRRAQEGELRAVS